MHEHELSTLLSFSNKQPLVNSDVHVTSLKTGLTVCFFGFRCQSITVSLLILFKLKSFSLVHCVCVCVCVRACVRACVRVCVFHLLLKELADLYKPILIFPQRYLVHIFWKAIF